MTRKFMLAAAVLGGLVLAGTAQAPGGAAAAIAAGTVGEQADGYLGIAGTVGADVPARAV